MHRFYLITEQTAYYNLKTSLNYSIGKSDGYHWTIQLERVMDIHAMGKDVVNMSWRYECADAKTHQNGLCCIP